MCTSDTLPSHPRHSLYIATKEGPGTRHIYNYNDDDSSTVCLTCSQETWDIPKSKCEQIVLFSFQ